MLFSLILFTIIYTAEGEVLSESFVIRLKELEAVIREQKSIIQNLTVTTSLNGKSCTDEWQANLTGVKQRLDLQEAQLELLHIGNPDLKIYAKYIYKKNSWNYEIQRMVGCKRNSGNQINH